MKLFFHPISSRIPGKAILSLALVGQLLLPVTVRAAESAKALPAPKDLPVQTAMPDPLIGRDGKAITKPAEWKARREEIKSIIEQYGIGHAPPPPGNVKGKDVEASLLAEGKVAYRRVHLSFGPEEKLGFDISIFTPAESTGLKGAFPTIVHPLFSGVEKTPVPSDAKPGRTPEDYAQQFAPALGRGYALAVFNYQDCGADNRDYRQSAFFPAYPDHDWADLAAWAWGMSRCVDYLEKQSFADKTKIIAAGHSRLGKATLVAGAFDERFALVAPAGSGCGGTGAYRFNGKTRGGKEGLEDVVKNFPQWMTPRFAEFSPAVETLPYDQHWLISLVAPRPFIAPDGLGDNATNVNALVQSYQAAKPVYALLGVPDHLGINFRPGGHKFAPEDWAAVLDFADQQLRGKEVQRRFDELPAPEPTK